MAAGSARAATKDAGELLARGAPNLELKLPSDAEVDKMISFLEKAWRRLIEMGRTVLKDVEKKN